MPRRRATLRPWAVVECGSHGCANVNRFATMLRTVYPPTVIKGSNSNSNSNGNGNGNGNWKLSMMEGRFITGSGSKASKIDYVVTGVD
jgi:hypothetical protein